MKHSRRIHFGRSPVDLPSDMPLRYGKHVDVGLNSVKFQRVLALLMEAAEYADQTSGNPWEFAVEIRHLLRLGLSENDLRFLVRSKYVVHACEVMAAGRNGRQFRRTGDLSFANRTCFILTPKGVAAAQRCIDAMAAGDRALPATIRLATLSEHGPDTSLPAWDRSRRTLFIAGQVVKRFRWQALNQEAILSAFQEEGWPLMINDPLVPKPSIDVKRRLSDTIKCLNRKQVNTLVHFRGDGTGQAVLWELVAPPTC